jgi:acyl-coenzyme A thioesterase PaaI-like protein
MVPYTGTIRPEVQALEPGHAVVAMDDRRAVRNHLRSIHAIALANLGEVSSGLAMLSGLPPGVRSIVTRLTITFEKKARGRLTAEARVTVPDVTEVLDHEVVAGIRDETGDQVAVVTVTWRLERGEA